MNTYAVTAAQGQAMDQGSMSQTVRSREEFRLFRNICVCIIGLSKMRGLTSHNKFALCRCEALERVDRLCKE